MESRTVKTPLTNNQRKKKLILQRPPQRVIPTKKPSYRKSPNRFPHPRTFNPVTFSPPVSLYPVPSWLLHPKRPHRLSHLQQFPCHPQRGRPRREEQDHQEEEEDKAFQIPCTTLLGPLAEGIRVAEGGILEEEAGVILETLEIPAEEEEAPESHQAMTNYQANNQPSLKGTDENRRPSCKNGTYTTELTDTPPK